MTLVLLYFGQIHRFSIRRAVADVIASFAEAQTMARAAQRRYPFAGE